MTSLILESRKTSYKVFLSIYLRRRHFPYIGGIESNQSLSKMFVFFQGDHWQDVYSGMHNSSFPFSLREEITKQDITGYYSSF